MKKSGFISIILSVVIILFFSLCAAANTPVSVYMNNKKIKFDVEPMIVNNSTMVPMRAIFEKIGAEVSWDNATKTAKAVKGRNYVSVTIGALLMDTFSGQVELDCPAMIVEGRTLIPLRAVSEVLNSEVKWDENMKTINIYSDYIDYTKESSVQTTVYVATPVELLNAIGSNKKIVLTSDYYNLSGLKEVNNEHVEKQPDYDGTYLDSYVIKNVVNMTIEGNAEIVTDDKMADVLRFEKCGKITLSGLTIGHTTSLEEYECEGSVVRFNICDSIKVENCNLYGCGAVGIFGDGVKYLNVSGGRIYDCTYSGIWLYNSSAIVNGTEFSDSVHFGGFLRIDSSVIKCADCIIRNIECAEWSGFISTLDWEDYPSEITFTNCDFSDNKFKDITDFGTKSIVFNNCIFNNNTGNMEHPNVIYNN
ncbi:MAG: right-handed parallel beta-helix repeat-containing protein [Clostridia bacterium]|nr:right-handed parallel beta-helix repeat-containing protein [Clostridia bacterium]